jgi:hypothetical protein
MSRHHVALVTANELLSECVETFDAIETQLHHMNMRSWCKPEVRKAYILAWRMKMRIEEIRNRHPY